MKFARIIFIAIFCVIVTFAAKEVDIEVEKGVLVLTEQNFAQALDDNPYILVEFYAPWCGHCKALEPEYAKAAEELEKSGSNIKLGKVDATIHSKLAEEHGVRGYPTLKFFRNGSPIEYSGGRKAPDIVSWVNKKSGPAAKTISTIEEFEDFIESKDVVVGFFKDAESERAKIFLEVANANDNYEFAIVHAQDIMDKQDVEDGKVVIFKTFDEGKDVFDGEFEVKNLQRFIQIHTFPLVVDFDAETAKKIFGGEVKSHLLFFISKEAGHYDKYLEEFRKAAKKFREHILFVTINFDEADHERIIDFFGMKKTELPAMRIIKLEQDMAKYKPENPELSFDNIQTFVQDFVDNKLVRDMLTQDLPEDWDKNPVKVLVATNFNEVVYDKSKSVLVEFYAPWCGHCKQLIPIYEELGEKMKDREDVVIAKMDATANELEQIKIEDFPTIILYRKNDNQAIEFRGERKIEALVKFVESDGQSEEVPEIQEEDEDDDIPRKDEL